MTDKYFLYDTVTFKSLTSPEEKLEALNLGYSPPIFLPSRVPFWGDRDCYTPYWTLTGETIEPFFEIYREGKITTQDFFNEDES